MSGEGRFVPASVHARSGKNVQSFTMVLYVNGAVPTMNIAKAKPGIPEVIQRVRAQAVERIITLTRGVILLMTLWLSEDNLAAQMQPRPEPYPPRAPEPQPFIPPSGVPERETIVVQIRSAYDEALGRHPNGSEEAGWTRDLMGRRNYVERRTRSLDNGLGAVACERE